MMDDAEQQLFDLREEIDDIDALLQNLINDRAELALKIAAIKIKSDDKEKDFYQPDREKEILRKIKEQHQGPLHENAITHIFELIIKECRDLQITTYKNKSSP